MYNMDPVSYDLTNYFWKIHLLVALLTHLLAILYLWLFLETAHLVAFNDTLGIRMIPSRLNPRITTGIGTNKTIFLAKNTDV